MASGILAAGVLLSLLCALLLPSTYTSTTTLMPPESASSSSSLMSLLGSAGSAAGVGSVGSAALGIKTPGALFTGILESRTVQESLVKQFDLVHQYKQRLTEDACKQLTVDTVIKEDPKNGIITISVKADNPVLASNLAQGYVVELNRVVTNNSTSAARRERMFLEERLKEIKKDLDDSGKALSQFSSKNKTIDVASQGKAMVDAVFKLETEQASARSELAGLRQAYSADNIRVRSASARVEELQREMDKLAGPSQRDGSTVATGGSDYPSVGELPILGLTYADLDRRVRVDEAVWEALTKQYETAKVQEAKEIPTVRVLDVANVPERKTPSARKIIVILGTIFSLFFACIVVFITNVWEGMDAEDEGKILVTDVWNALLNSLAWVRHIPGINRLYARVKGSK